MASGWFFVFTTYLLLLLLSCSPHVEGETIVCDPTRFSKAGIQMDSLPYCNKSLSFETRARDLVSRMTLEEKVGQLGDNSSGVERLNIPRYKWWNEALHGVSDVGRGTHFDNVTRAATSFPTVILLAASFNETLWKSVAVAISDEARALYNLGLSGLTFWSPNVNPARDPRWGRITETPGEDPFLIGRYAVNYVRGMQDVVGSTNTSDPNSRPLKVAACCKHFAAYDVDHWKGVDRFSFDAQVTERDMLETFLYPFEVCVKEADVASIMCSYNRVNGIPACADPKLLNQTIRGLWGLHGYIVADCDSVQVMQRDHRFLNDTPEAAVAQALKAGLDLDCGSSYSDFGIQAVKEGKARVADIDRSLQNLYILLMRLGWFDGDFGTYNALGRENICSFQHLELAVEAARQGIVLLKNERNVLPFHFIGERPTLAVIGPHANATVAMIGNYALKTGVACRYSTPIEALKSYGNVKYAAGCLDTKCSSTVGIAPAIEAVRAVNATILFVGLDLSIEAEGLDRTNLKFPGFQELLISSIVNASDSPTVLVIFSAGGIDISSLKNNPRVSAILWAGYPGAEGGQAIVDILFGNHNPGARLPITWYPADYVEKLPMTSMDLRPVDGMKYPGRTYKFYNGTTVYPFGYGLSYTNFSCTIKSAPSQVSLQLQTLQQSCKQIDSNGSVPKCQAVLVQDLRCSETINIVVEVTNRGTRDGSYVVLLYSAPPSYVVGAPIKRLIGFRKVFVKKWRFASSRIWSKCLQELQHV